MSRTGFALLLSTLLLVSGCLHAVTDPKPPPEVEGCTDPSALNYDANATVDDGSCEYPPPPPPPPPPGDELPSEVPTHFAEWMRAPVNGTTYHFAANEPCAADSNDGLSATCDGQGEGPWKTFQGMVNIDPVPGDELLFHAGTYDIEMTPNTSPRDGTGNGISLPYNGTAEEPLRISAAPGVSVWWDAHLDPAIYGNDASGYLDDWKKVDTILIRGNNIIFEGINVRGCGSPTCIQWSGHHLIWTNSTISGGTEDGIKTTRLASDGLMWNLSFRDFSGEALDAYGINGLWLVDADFTANNPRFNANGDNGTTMWMKGGANDIWILDSEFHDMVVKAYSLMIGGCCWNNWPGNDSNGNPLPVATNVHALRNTFSNITHGSNKPENYYGALGVEGCHYCEVRDNLLIGVDAVFGIHATNNNGTKVEPRNVTFANNTVVGGAWNGVHRIWHDPVNLIIDDNTYFVDTDLIFHDRTTTYDGLADWVAGTGWDANSVQYPEGQWSGGGGSSGSSPGTNGSNGTGDDPANSSEPELFPLNHSVDLIELIREDNYATGSVQYSARLYRNEAYRCGLEPEHGDQQRTGHFTFLLLERTDLVDQLAPLWVFIHGGGVGYYDENGYHAGDPQNSNHEETYSKLIGYAPVSGGADTVSVRAEEGYRILIPSMCDHDFHSGIGSPYPHNPAWNGSDTVDGLLALMAAVDFTVNGNSNDSGHTTSHVFVHGTSAGAAGAHSVAYAFAQAGVNLTGAVFDSTLVGERQTEVMGFGWLPPEQQDENFTWQGVVEKIGVMLNDSTRFVENVVSAGFPVPLIDIVSSNDPFCGGTGDLLPAAQQAGVETNCDYVHQLLREAIDAAPAGAHHAWYREEGQTHVLTRSGGDVQNAIDVWLAAILADDPSIPWP